MKRKLYRQPVESAKHEQLKQACLEYFTQYEKLMKNPSMRFAFKARKALQRLKKVAHERGLELLDLYAPSKNIGKVQINPFIKNNINKNMSRHNPILVQQKGETYNECK